MIDLAQNSAFGIVLKFGFNDFLESIKLVFDWSFYVFGRMPLHKKHVSILSMTYFLDDLVTGMLHFILLTKYFLFKFRQAFYFTNHSISSVVFNDKRSN